MRSFLSGVVISFIVGIFALAPLFERKVHQPIAFDHLVHQAEADCLGCHASADTQSFAGLPPMEDCQICHDNPPQMSPPEQAVWAAAEEGELIPWQGLYRQPGHVFFSHRRHVEMAGLECRTCHAEIVDSERPPLRVRNLSMKDCMACHAREGARNDCIDCHR